MKIGLKRTDAPPFLIAAVLLAAVPFSALAQQSVCGKRGDVLKQLSLRHSETPAAMGLSNTGGILEVLTSPASGSWTIIMTMPNGMSCLVAAGENWESVAPLFEPGQGT